jgi:tRNA (cytidine/uridine-2'-O-)-methyltransferase
MFRIVLVHPEIPPNTGNVIRLAANTGCALHLIEPLGFIIDDRHVRRAGLDYHELASVQRHASWDAFLAEVRPEPSRCFAYTTRGSRPHTAPRFARGDVLVFGSESQGLPAALREWFAAEQQLRLPMLAAQRSMNLSNVVAVAVFEAWRQCSFAGGASPNAPAARGIPPWPSR